MGTVDCRIGHSMRLGAVAPRLRVRQSRLLGRRKEPSDIGGVVRGHDPTILDHRGPCVEGVDLPGARASTHNGAAGKVEVRCGRYAPRPAPSNTPSISVRCSSRASAAKSVPGPIGPSNERRRAAEPHGEAPRAGRQGSTSLARYIAPGDVGMPRSTQVGAGDLGATRRVNDHRDSLRSGRLVNGGLPIADPCAVGGETGPDFVRR